MKCGGGNIHVECGKKKIMLEWRRDIVSNKTKKEKKGGKKEERKTIRGEEGRKKR